MRRIMKRLAAAATAIPIAIGLLGASANADTIRIALAETPSDELAAFFVALDRAKANGLDGERRGVVRQP